MSTRWLIPLKLQARPSRFGLTNVIGGRGTKCAKILTGKPIADIRENFQEFYPQKSMNSAINSTLSASRLNLSRQSKAYRQRIFKRLLIGFPIIATVGWEYRVWKRQLYYSRNQSFFTGSTPFYGKMWGYESDYMIETSLGDGDLVFWAADPLSIHLHEAVCRFLYRHLKGDYDAWDFCGIVKKVNGKAYVFGPDGSAVLYSDLVSDARTTSVAIRRLVDTSESGQSRRNIVSSIKEVSFASRVPIDAPTLWEYSIKSVVSRFFPSSESRPHSMLISLVRDSFRTFPLNALSEETPAFVEISDVFNNLLVNKEAGTSYSPPFFVRRFDNEYYNHNRTKNIIVDWELLTQRDIKNKLVSEHQRTTPS